MVFQCHESPSHAGPTVTLNFEVRLCWQKEAGTDSICTWSSLSLHPCLLDLMETGEQKAWKYGFTFSFFCGRVALNSSEPLSEQQTDYSLLSEFEILQIGYFRACPEPLGGSAKKPTHRQLGLSSHCSWLPLCRLQYVALQERLSILNTAVPPLSVVSLRRRKPDNV